MQVKGSPPVEHLAGRRALPLIEAYFEINHLKRLFRQGWLRCGVDEALCESVAEHSFGVTMLAMLVADRYAPDLDASRILRMSLVHDLGEIYAGDITPYHGVERSEKKRREAEGVAKVLGKLPGGERYVELWNEYEANDSAEAQFVHAIDRLELVLQATIYEHEGSEDLSEFYTYVESALADPRFAEIVAGLENVRRQPAGQSRRDHHQRVAITVDFNDTNPENTSEFFADPRLIVDENGRAEGRIRLSVLNGTGLPLAVIVVSAELRYQPEDPEPFALLGPATVESWEPPYFAAGAQTFEFDLSYGEELEAIIGDISITYIVVATEFRGAIDDDLIDDDLIEGGGGGS